MRSQSGIGSGASSQAGTERVIVLNSVAASVVESRRRNPDDFVFTFRGEPVAKLHNSGWRRAWRASGLPTQRDVRRGIHNLRHTFPTWLRAAGVPLERRKALLGHATGDITTHYSAPEIGELLAAAEKATDRGRAETPVLGIVTSAAQRGVGKVPEMKTG